VWAYRTGGDESAAYAAKVIQSVECLGLVASSRLTRCIGTVREMQSESQAKRCPRKPSEKSRRQQAFTLAAWGVTAGGSGTESMEAVTNSRLNTDAMYKTDFIPYSPHDSEFSSSPGLHSH